MTNCDGDRDYYVGRTGCCEKHLEKIIAKKEESGARTFSVRVSAVGQKKGLGKAGSGSGMDMLMRALAGEL